MCEMSYAREQNDQPHQKMKPSILEILNFLEKITLNDGMVVLKSLRR